MEINRSNYEIWLIDWLDGNLNDQQVAQLKHFLGENPELKEEFEELNSLSLKPSVKVFTGKEDLKKIVSDLPSSQFELLCVAFLENDISGSEQTELMQFIENDPDKKRTFELIQKTRLAPADINYRFKNNLLRRTTVQRVIRLSIIGLSAAAAIALIIMTYMIIPRNFPDNTINTAQNIPTESIRVQPPVDVEPVRILTDNNTGKSTRINTIPDSRENKYNSGLPQSDVTETINDSSLIKNSEKPDIDFIKIPVNATIDLSGVIVSNVLIASNSFFNIPSYDDERTNLSRFFSRTFREKILKENTPSDRAVKGYEIAEAGVTGLNKLLGWEMALEKNNDENGELKSVYFSSKILKFNAPVRKSEPLP